MIKHYTDIYELFSEAYSFSENITILIIRQIEEYKKNDKSNNSDLIPVFLANFTKDLELLFKEESEKYFLEDDAISKNLQKVEDFVSTFENIIIKNQLKERFYPQKEDKFTLKIAKFGKRVFQEIVWIAPKTKNVYLKLKKQETKQLNYKNHKLKKKELGQLVFVNYFLNEIYSSYNQTLFNRQNLLIRLKKIEKKISNNILINKELNTEDILNSLNLINSDIEKYRNQTRLDIEKIEQKLLNQFENLQLKYGTFEFPTRKTKPKTIVTQRKKLNNKLKTTFNSYKLAYNSLASYFLFKLDIQKGFIDGSVAFANTNKEIEGSFEENIELKTNLVFLELENWLYKNKDEKEFDTTKLSDKILNTQLNDLKNSIIQVDIANSIEQLETQIQQLNTNIDTIIEIPITGNFVKPLNQQQLKKINTDVIIQGNFEQNIKLKFSNEKREVIRKIQNILQKTNEISEIIEFSLDYIDSNANNETNRIDFINGIKRVSVKIAEFSENVQHIKEDIYRELITIKIDSINSLYTAIEPHTIILYIKKQLRANRIKQINEKANHFVETIIKFVKKVKEDIINAYLFLKNKYVNLQKIFGINTNVKRISNDLTDFLSETDTTINNLPLMYQKLFKSEALTKEKFYIPRENVNNELKNAFNSWNKKKFAPTCLIGESGSGITTTINFLEKEIDQKYPISRFCIETQITQEAEFLTFLKKVFNDISFETILDLKNKLEEQNSKRIIIIENIHNLFARYNGGFKNINSFIDIISLTNSNVFWVCSANMYPWKYLDFAINISDYFGYIVPLESLKKEQVIKILANRHLPSGYNINFLKRNEFRTPRNYKNLKPKDRQKLLRNDFINILYNNTQGNIKLALLFWQSYVVKIENDTFYFKIKEIDHSFLEILGIKKIIILHNILIHDGLSIDKYSQIFGITKSQSLTQLTVLVNDAILVKKDDDYNINPLLYRQVVNHLKSINFIY